jgi:DNA-binding NarL/FixJ family response regulator
VDGPIAIRDRVEVYRRGLAAVLEEAGHRVEPTASAPLGHVTPRAIMLSIRAPEDWEELQNLVPRPTPVIALVPEGDDGAAVRALRSGAAGVIGRAAPVEEIIATVEAAVHGQVRLTLDLARRIMVSPTDAPTIALTDQEVAWLRSLAAGVRIADLAHISGHSERAMYRLLRHLYDRMGASDRTGALLTATRWGLLTEDVTPAPDTVGGLPERTVPPEPWPPDGVLPVG